MYTIITLTCLCWLKFEAGPQASYLLNVKNNTKEFVNGNETSSTTTDIDKDGMKEFELGYAAGIGLTSGGLSVGVRYNGSFSDFVDDAPNTYFNGDLANAKHSVFMLTLGFTLPTGR